MRRRTHLILRLRLLIIAATAVSAAALLAGQDRRLTVPSAAERRVALVIGNDSYTGAPLQNARNDARSMARALEGLGFQVRLLEDASRQALVSAVSAFGDGLQPTDVALFYFAGHGVQVENENFLIPTDFRGQSASEARLSGLGAADVQRLLQRARVSMLVLDACRNNPFTGARGGGGLASMEARGSLIAFATGAGQTAADAGSGANGLFTQELVRALGQAGLSAQEVFRRVRQSVYDASGGRQFPVAYDGLLGDFVFRPAAGRGTAPAAAASVTTPRDADLALRAELALWDAIKDSNTVEPLEDYIVQYPTGRFRVVAEARLRQMRGALAVGAGGSGAETGVSGGRGGGRGAAVASSGTNVAFAPVDPAFRSASLAPVNPMANPYTPIQDFFRLPAGREWGAVGDIDIDRDGGSLWVASRCRALGCRGSANSITSVPSVLKFDDRGNPVMSIGTGRLILPSGIDVDGEGNIWVTDAQDNVSAERAAARGAPAPVSPMPAVAATRGHQVFKFRPSGELLMTLGRAGGGRAPDYFFGPTDVLVGPSSDIFVSEGTSSATGTTARILKFDRTGRFITSWGHFGAADGEFQRPTSLAMDSRGRLFVADTDNNRIQIFDQDGRFLDKWYQFGRPSGLFIDKNDTLYVADSQSTSSSHAGWQRGIRIGSARDGRVTAFIPDTGGDAVVVSGARTVAADANESVYGGEALRAMKYVRR